MSNIRLASAELGVLPASQWRSSLGASGLLLSPSAASPLGTAMSGVVFGTGMCAVATRTVVRHRTEAAIAAASGGVPAGALAPAGVPSLAHGAKQLGQPTHNQTHIEKQYVTSVNANGVGASGPPRRWEPA